MQTVNVRKVRAQISQLLDAVEVGEEIIIQRNGKPIARLVPIEVAQTPVRFPDRRAFRNQFPASRKDSADLVRELRDDERF
jgi:prevent-host-death family protein